MPRKDLVARREYSRVYRETHKDELRERSKRYRIANRVAIYERQARWRVANPDKVRAMHARSALKLKEYKAQWAREHPQKITDEQRAKRRIYHAKWREANREHVNRSSLEWVRKNPERSAQMRESTRNKRREANRIYNREYHKNNPHVTRANVVLRRARKLNATPGWARHEDEKIKGLYATARKLTAEYGKPYHVDHIVPLKSRLVCGLHCFDNLQVILGADNLRKLNVRWPDMPT